MQLIHPELVWHGPQERILSIDFHPFIPELVTGGSDQISGEQCQFDGYAKAWHYEITPEGINTTFKFALKKHSNNVSVVKYSPDARYLATGSDDHDIIVWEMRQNFTKMNGSEKKMMWCSRYELKGHSCEVTDLRWTSDGKYIISSGFDKRIFIWNYPKNQYIKILEEHNKPVQGLAVDPFSQFIISQGTDRLVKVWKNHKSKKDDSAYTRFATLDRVQTLEIKAQMNGENSSQNDRFLNNNEKQDSERFRIFIDESLPTFFRRPDISPDGELFLFVGAQWKDMVTGKFQFGALAYRRRFLSLPSAFIRSQGKAVLCAKFCPKLFKKTDLTKGMLDLPYYMVFALGTYSSTFVYNTLDFHCLYSVSNCHYASITEISWKDQTLLGVSSNDRTCSFISFAKNELGQIYQPEDEVLRSLMTRKPYEKVQNDKEKEKQKDRKSVKGKSIVVPEVIKDEANVIQVPQPVILEVEQHVNLHTNPNPESNPNVDCEDNKNASNEPPKPAVNVNETKRKKVMPKVIQKFD